MLLEKSFLFENYFVFLSRFEECLLISPHLYPLNCLKSVSAEIKCLKDHLCEVRSKLLEVCKQSCSSDPPLCALINYYLLLPQVQPKYPRVIELIARRTETLRVEQPNLKVMSWDNLKTIILNEVNKLLSDRQLSFILRCLTNAGVVSSGMCINSFVLIIFFSIACIF